MSRADALLLVSFGGPEGPQDVAPFLANVTRGRGIPADRLAQVAGHYQEVFGGVSPINEQSRRLRDALAAAQDRPVYWGTRNWHPFLAETLAEMREDGIQHAHAILTSAFPSYSGCRQYLDDIERARSQVPGAPVVTRLRHYYCEPGFLDAVTGAVAEQLVGLPAATRLVFTAHSIPLAAAATSGPRGDAYPTALRTAAARVVDRLGPGRAFDLVFQSRSGSPSVPWLGPDVSDHLEGLVAAGVPAAVIVPIGFTSDHVEVQYDLDVVARSRVAGRMELRRAATVGTDPRFVAALVGLADERDRGPERDEHGCVATHDRCPATCCPPPPWPAPSALPAPTTR